MQKFLLTIFTIVLVSSLGFAEMNLKLNQNLLSETNSSIINNNLKSNLKLEVPAAVVSPPADMHELVRGLMLLGILADVSFPMGSDNGFKHIAGTAWSGHIEFSYFVSPMFRIMFRGGYINFGTQTESGSEDLGFGQTYDYSYEDTYSQIPILIGGYYMITTGSGFKPYIGLAIGMFFETYKVNWTDNFGYNVNGSFTSSGFGVVPGVGAYYMAGSVLIQFAVEYTYVFSDGPTVDDNYDYEYYKLNKSAGIAQDDYSDEGSDDKPSYFSVVAGVSFPLGK
jgi:outer membrane protein W